ncbi:hypothetical protein GHS75_004453 [Escherichia coli]|nr:hypothetical protein [Escherichia coli]EER2209144.1 hypothetical protein [Escherichia coli]EER3218130.1 hypothetical protein [Escherichia coli]EER9975573.1 hypothetical protein [Escherichia coli]EEY6691452.1 hypothetical protein [Escherichia coli]
MCVGCGYSGVRDGAGKNAPVWVKVNPESGLGLCSGCDSFLLQERQRRQRHDQLFSCGLSCKQRKTEGAVYLRGSDAPGGLRDMEVKVCLPQ